jgi:hypothetical protein
MTGLDRSVISWLNRQKTSNENGAQGDDDLFIDALRGILVVVVSIDPALLF